MDMNKKFIYTDNPETKIKLERSGYRLFKEFEDGSGWVFINSNNLSFENFSATDGIIMSDSITF